MLIGFGAFAIAMTLRRRLREHPTAMIWLVIALLAVGRFVEFFARSDSATTALGLETAQWTSIALLLLAAVGAWIVRKRSRATSARGSAR
jgi:prolipoprotein diacylglyceryltransferase